MAVSGRPCVRAGGVMLVAISTCAVFQDIIGAWFCIPRTYLEKHREPGMVQSWEVTSLEHGLIVVSFFLVGALGGPMLPRVTKTQHWSCDPAYEIVQCLEILLLYFLFNSIPSSCERTTELPEEESNKNFHPWLSGLNS